MYRWNPAYLAYSVARVTHAFREEFFAKMGELDVATSQARMYEDGLITDEGEAMLTRQLKGLTVTL